MILDCSLTYPSLRLYNHDVDMTNGNTLGMQCTMIFLVEARSVNSDITVIMINNQWNRPQLPHAVLFLYSSSYNSETAMTCEIQQILHKQEKVHCNDYCSGTVNSDSLSSKHEKWGTTSICISVSSETVLCFFMLSYTAVVWLHLLTHLKLDGLTFTGICDSRQGERMTLGRMSFKSSIIHKSALLLVLVTF